MVMETFSVKVPEEPLLLQAPPHKAAAITGTANDKVVDRNDIMDSFLFWPKLRSDSNRRQENLYA
jgi:hypothetical protein